TWNRRCTPSTARDVPVASALPVCAMARRNREKQCSVWPRASASNRALNGAKHKLRILMRTTLALLTLLLAGSAVHAQSNVKVRIDDARVGFKVRGDVDAYKAGTWTPVYVDLTAGGERIENGEADLVLETSDNDDMQNSYAVRLPALDPKEQR